MATVELTKDNFNETIENNDIVLVDFWAPWCAPCRSFAPVFESLSEAHPHIVFAKLNTEEEQEVAAAYQIRSIPTLMLIREKVLLFTQPGALAASQLEDVLSKAQELDMDQVRAEITKQEQGDNTASG